MHSQTHVFISYSRKDGEVAQVLRDRLLDDRFDAYLDVYDIVKGEPWQDRLRGLIERADTVVFLVSPDSVASQICEWEINEAELREKRIFPVVVRETATAEIPQRLQRLNFTFLDTAEKWRSEYPLLLSALNQDVFWIREHTRLGELALRWDRAERPNRLLLRGADLAAAERWRDQRAASAPQLSSLHTDFLRGSRLGSQQRLRAWLLGSMALALFAVGLSTFAYWQRDLAVRNGETAERRAAELAVDVALSRADQGLLNQGLLMLLDASTRYDDDPVPEKLQVAMHDVTRRAMSSRAFWFSSQARAFHLERFIMVADPEAGSIFRIDPLTGDQRKIASYGGHDISAMAVVGGDLLYLSTGRHLFRVPDDPDEPVPAMHLVSLGSADDKAVGWFVPYMSVLDSGEVLVRRVFEHAATGETGDRLWRFDPSVGKLRYTDVPGNIGDLVGIRQQHVYFWDPQARKMRVLDLDTAGLTSIGAGQFSHNGIAPCRQQAGESGDAHIGVIAATVRPGLEAVRCDGLYGSLALIGQTRALARGTMEEYFLLPAGADVDTASTAYSLQSAFTRLGSIGKHKPINWHAGSADDGLVAVSYADRIMLLGLRAEYLQSLLPVDDDHVAREIVTPEVTDGGRFFDDGRFAYSGPDGDRYRVTVLNLKHAAQSQDWPVVDYTPERAYWGNCGNRRPNQRQRPGLHERAFAVDSSSDGRYQLRLGGRSALISAGDIRCASMSAAGMRLAVVDESGLALFDISGEKPEALARIADSSIQAASFLGARQQTLLTSHDFKVMAWRIADDGQLVGETVYRSQDSIIFAEGAPDADRMLVWLSLGQADAMIRLVPVPHNGLQWMVDGPYMLAFNPDVFFDRRGAVYRHEQEMFGELMPPVTLANLREKALTALSPSCRPRSADDFRSSACWPTGL